MESYKTLCDNMCRLCLKCNTENMVSLFENGNLNYYGQAILPFANIYLKKDDILPNFMCSKCLVLLRQCIYFKFMCETSDRKLKQLKSLVKDNFKQKMVKRNLNKDRKSKNISNELLSQSKMEEKLEKCSGNFIYNENNCSNNHLNLSKTKNKATSKIYLGQMTNNTQKEIVDIKEYDSLNNASQCWDLSRQKVKEDPDKLLDELEKFVQLNDDISDTEYIAWPKKRKRRLKKYDVNMKNKKTRTCKICFKELATSSSYFIHLQKHDTGSRFICEYCGRSCTTRVGLHMHLVALHGAGPSIQCPHCPFKASRRFDMIEHERIHTGERPFACEKCGRTFRRKDLHRKHLILHSEKTVSCSYCPKKFFKRADMLEHCNSIHERRYMFVCSECGTLYAKISTVRRHLVEKHGIPREKQKKVLRVMTSKAM